MKTQIAVKMILLCCSVTMIFISCSKQEDNFNQVTIPSVTRSPHGEIGTITDTGIVNPGIRFMETKLYEQFFTLRGSNEELAHAMVEVNVAFYVDSDGQIPTGEYTFSGSKTPFTFDSGSLIYTQLFSTKIDQIVGGKIAVSLIGDTYVLSLQIQLESGMTASQVYHGSLVYSDSQ